MAAEWTFDIGEFRVAAERKGYVRVTLEMETDSLDVDCEQGSGYGREHITFSIPIDVLKKLLAGQAPRVEGETK